MSMLDFYTNRAGKNLSDSRRRVLASEARSRSTGPSSHP
jgi:hypothetical protein